MPSKKDLVLWDTRQKRLQGSLLLDVKTEWDRRASLNVPLVQLFCTKRGICLFYDIQPACKKTLLWHITYMSLLWQIGLWCSTSTITFPIRKQTLFFFTRHTFHWPNNYFLFTTTEMFQVNILVFTFEQ